MGHKLTPGNDLSPVANIAEEMNPSSSAFVFTLRICGNYGMWLMSVRARCVAIGNRQRFDDVWLCTQWLCVPAMCCSLCAGDGVSVRFAIRNADVQLIESVFEIWDHILGLTETLRDWWGNCRGIWFGVSRVECWWLESIVLWGWVFYELFWLFDRINKCIIIFADLSIHYCH